MCDDDCPYCGARHMQPYTSDDLTFVVEESDGSFVVHRSPHTAEHNPDYVEVGRFPSEEQANAFVGHCLALDESSWVRGFPTL
jgi:hypothetical protein